MDSICVNRRTPQSLFNTSAEEIIALQKVLRMENWGGADEQFQSWKVQMERIWRLISGGRLSSLLSSLLSWLSCSAFGHGADSGSIAVLPMSGPVTVAVGAASEANVFAGSSKILKRRLNFAASRFMLGLEQPTQMMTNIGLGYDYL